MNRGYSLDFMDPETDNTTTHDKNEIDPYAIDENASSEPELYYEQSNIEPVEIIVVKDNLTTEIVYNVKFSENSRKIDPKQQKEENGLIKQGKVVGTFGGDRITYEELENDNESIKKVIEIFKKHIDDDNLTMYELLIELAKKIKLEDFITEEKFDFMQSIERLMFRVENNQIKEDMLKALGLDFKENARKTAKEKDDMLKELEDRETAARALENSVLLIAAYLVSHKLYNEDPENQINELEFKGKTLMDKIKYEASAPVEQSGGGKSLSDNIPISKLLDDINSIENMLNIVKHESKKTIKNSKNKIQHGGFAVNNENQFEKLVELMYNCENKKTPAAKLKSIQKVIDTQYPEDKKEKDTTMAKLYKKCRPQSGGMLGLGGLDYDAKNAKSDIINSFKAQGLKEHVKNPYFIPHHLDERIGEHLFSFSQPCPEGRASTICSIFAALSGRTTKGGGGNISDNNLLVGGSDEKGNKSTTIKARFQKLGNSINEKLGVKKLETAKNRGKALFKSPESENRVTAGVKNTRNALLNNGVVRAIKDRNINPNNVPYIMNEGKLKNYLQLMQWYFLGDMLLDDKQISDNMTVRSGRRIKRNNITGKEEKFSDDLKRESTALTLTVNPEIEKQAYMPKVVNSRRLIANANNVVLGNMADPHLTDPGYNKIYQGNYGKLAPRKGDDLALAFWLGFR